MVFSAEDVVMAVLHSRCRHYIYGCPME